MLRIARVLFGDINSLTSNESIPSPTHNREVTRLSLSPERGLAILNQRRFIEKSYVNSRIRPLIFDTVCDTPSSSRGHVSPVPSSPLSSREYVSPGASSPQSAINDSPIDVNDPRIYRLACLFALCCVRMNTEPHILISFVYQVLTEQIQFDAIRSLGILDRVMESCVIPSSIPSPIPEMVTPSSSVPVTPTHSPIPPIDESVVANHPVAHSDEANHPVAHRESSSLGFKFFIGATLLIAVMAALSFYGSTGVDSPTTFLPT